LHKKKADQFKNLQNLIDFIFNNKFVYFLRQIEQKVLVDASAILSLD